MIYHFFPFSVTMCMALDGTIMYCVEWYSNGILMVLECIVANDILMVLSGNTLANGGILHKITYLKYLKIH